MRKNGLRTYFSLTIKSQQKSNFFDKILSEWSLKLQKNLLMFFFLFLVLLQNVSIHTLMFYKLFASCLYALEKKSFEKITMMNSVRTNFILA